MRSNRFTIQGAEKIITDNTELAYIVRSGRVFVYIVPFIKNKSGKRLFLAECTDGDVIIPLNCEAILLDSDDIRTWKLIIVPIECSEIETVAANDQYYTDFSEKIGIKCSDKNMLEELIIEKYRIDQVTSLRNIYVDDKTTAEATRSSLNAILQQFRKDGVKSSRETGAALLYDAVYTLCNKNNIEIISYSEIKNACGTRFSVEDIAHLSGFPVRKVKLVEKWYKKDSGDLLVFDKESNQPFVAIQKGSSKYNLIDIVTKEPIRIDESVAETLSQEAYTFYRPFPNKEIKSIDLIKYIMSQISMRDVFYTFFLAAVGALISLLLPYLNEKIYDMYIPLGYEEGLISLCVLILSCMIGNVSFTFVNGLAQFRNNTRMLNSVEAAMIDRVFNISSTDLGNIESADLIQRILGVSQGVNTVFSFISNNGVNLVLAFIFYIRMYTYSPELSIKALVMVLIITAAIVTISISGYKLSRKQLALDGSISSVLFQLLTGISKLKMAGAEERGLNEYMKQYSESMSLQKRIGYRNSAISIINRAATLIFSIVLFYVMVRESLSISVGQFVGFNTAFGSFAAAFLTFATQISVVEMTMPAFKRADIVFNSIPETEQSSRILKNVSGDIEIDNLKFAYSEDTPLVLDGINLHIHSGEYIGIVGSSGCGKSTLLKLMLGFEKPTEGKIYYDGQDLDNINKKQLRRKLGIVLQDGALISGSIYDNVTITAPNASMETVEKTLEAVGIKEDIEAMPMGLNTPLSECAGQISGGQKQRLMIARAIINNPNVLLFDEATSALDNLTQAHLADSLDKMKSTRIVIAHRLSTIKNCDRIIVLDKGQIAESGTYDELMKADGLFAQFSRRQMQL